MAKLAGSERETRLIQKVLDTKRLNPTNIARRLRLSRQVVSDTLWGRKNNRKVLTLFLNVGCDPKHLDLPPKFKKIVNLQVYDD